MGGSESILEDARWFEQLLYKLTLRLFRENEEEEEEEGEDIQVR